MQAIGFLVDQPGPNWALGFDHLATVVYG